ncbi:MULTISPECIES: hypothetical protein [unclassified Myxococcus]|uniref:hypothetical protein n=1 Tax=unclassified Myxococcus TaxID=2648731 RepID=UPI00159637EB|nr:MULTISPECIES: hypothetical protein [unclassified Myxococcus]NVI96836.1 hypothetical protein [Myxococcus sp. AM009]NVJ15717.1 hypothetical protein [Myxococcus sp. AM010]WIG93103.1 hypothetical protein KGD87_21085 [Myxococcus sp. SDU36]
MTPIRFRIVPRFLLPGAILASMACATGPTGRPPVPPSSAAVQTELGARDVVQAGEEYARNNAVVLAEASEAVEIRPNYWRIRFGLADQPGRFLEVEFDELTRQVTNARELDVIPENPGDAALGGSGPVPAAGQPRGPIP